MSFDKIAAVYVYCMDYHTGQWSREYRILSRISSQYRLKLTDSAIKVIQSNNNEWQDASQIYNQSVKTHAI
jgi:hypothetical protein